MKFPSAYLATTVYIETASHGLKFVQESLKILRDVGATSAQQEKGWLLIFRTARSYQDWEETMRIWVQNNPLNSTPNTP